MSPLFRSVNRFSLRKRLAASGLLLIMVVGTLGVGAVLADHPLPPLPLEENSVKGLSNCNTNGVTGTNPQAAIPTGQVGNATTPPDRINGSTSNEAITGTKQALVIHANADNDGVPVLGNGAPKELTLDVSGSFNIFDGELDTRSHAKVGGSWNLFRHGFEYGQRTQTTASSFSDKPAFDLGGSDNCFSPPPNQEYENAPPNEAPAGFPQQAKFDPDNDGNILEHFAPGTTPANNAIAHTGAISIDVDGNGTPDITEAAQPSGRYFVCGISPLPAGARQAPGCSGSGASAIMDRSLQGQALEFGLYFVTGRVKLSASNLNALVTIVSGQQLNVNGSFQGQGFSVFSPYTDATGVVPTGTKVVGTLLFGSQWDNATSLSGPSFGDPTANEGSSSNDTPNTGDKADDALKIEGSLSRFEGIIVATNGRTEVAGEKLDFRCPVMGDRVRVNGSKNYFNAAGCVPAPSITISKSPDGGALGTIKAGDTAQFTITVTNSGTVALTNVDIDDTLPNGNLTWVITSALKAGAALPAGDACALIVATDTLHCDIANLAAGQNVVVVVTSSATSSAHHCGNLPNGGGNGILDNGSLDAGDARATSTEVGPVTDPGHIIVQCPDVTVLKTGNGTIDVGTNAVFTILITNLGPGTSSLVTLDPDGAGPLVGDTLPDDGLDWSITSQGFENAAFTGGTSCALSPPPAVPPPPEDTLTCSIVDLSDAATNNSYRIVLTAATSTDDCGPHLNTVVVSATGDINPNNNTSNDTITVRCGALQITKTAKHVGAGSANLVATFTIVDFAGNTRTLTTNAAGLGCIDGVAVGTTQSITESTVPPGYLAPTIANVNVPSGTCNGAVLGTGGVNVNVANKPLTDVTITINSQVPGATRTTVTCDDPATLANPDFTFTTPSSGDGNLSMPNLPVPPNLTLNCTIVIDP